MKYDLENVNKDLLLEATLFLAANFGWSQSELDNEYDIYGSVPFMISTARINKRLVGTVWMYNKKGKLGDKEFKILGIGGVCTHRDYRGKGIGQRLLEQSLNHNSSKEMDFALLTCDLKTNKNFYKKSGFKVLPGGYQFTTKITDEIMYEDQAMIYMFKDENIPNQLLGVNSIIKINGANF
jgi:predicted GNAT family N-acyltransferase